jgi:hypothetical protein
MQSNKWGKHCWEFCHNVSFNYPINPSKSDKDSHKLFYENLKNILPCSVCRCSYSFFYENFPIDEYLDDRHGVVYWLYIVHNIVNLKLNNELMSFKDVILKYENNRARCGNIDTKNTDILLECQKPIEWNDEMEIFYRYTITKYEKNTIKKLAKLLKYNPDHKDILKILKNIKC